MSDETPRPDGGDAVRTLRHELRTPVNHIVGYAELLLEDAEGGGADEIAAGLTEIRAAGTRALAAIAEIAGQAAAGAGAPEPSRAGEALAAIAEQVAARAAALRAVAREQGRATVAPDLEKIEAAARQLGTLVAGHVPSVGRVAAGEAAGADRPGTVLVVDDNELNRDMLSRRLERLGYRVLLAEDGRRALDVMRAQDVDVALLDIMMPEMDGYAVLEHRRTDARLREIPVIMISAVDEIESVARCITLGAEDYLPKPFNPVLLRARLDACLERKRRRDREVADLDAVRGLTDAAASLETGTFRPDVLAAVAARKDALGGLARVFLRMADQVRTREEELRAQLRERSYVFLSYASADRDRAIAVARQIEAAGVRVWVDQQEIAAGASWSAEIVQSIRGCTALLVACSPAAMESRNVRQEIQLAWKYGRPYVPLILDTVHFPDEVEYQLEGWQWVEVLEHPPERWLPPLLAALARLGVETSAAM